MLSVSKLERQATSGPQKGQSLILFTVHNITDCILASSIYPSVGWILLAERLDSLSRKIIQPETII